MVEFIDLHHQAWLNIKFLHKNILKIITVVLHRNKITNEEKNNEVLYKSNNIW